MRSFWTFNIIWFLSSSWLLIKTFMGKQLDNFVSVVHTFDYVTANRHWRCTFLIVLGSYLWFIIRKCERIILISGMATILGNIPDRKGNYFLQREMLMKVEIFLKFDIDISNFYFNVKQRNARFLNAQINKQIRLLHLLFVSWTLKRLLLLAHFVIATQFVNHLGILLPAFE